MFFVTAVVVIAGVEVGVGVVEMVLRTMLTIHTGVPANI